ncbi:putative membrane protein [Erwinia phage Hena1]|jgi:hypothetical protein|uniref:Putative membrane protein n=1 Tax=Erwinia phage Hena1 TaxID=2678601 RepID=A0A6B9J5T5_9CAUD|nr:membrane protein [Erwinia phage Hena1]QGZ16245.1 putative membrane protein [Erwinia phage Hena1]
MKYYLNGLFIFVYLVITFGFGAPALVSASDTIAVIAGFAWLGATPVVLYYWIRLAFKKKAEPVEV